MSMSNVIRLIDEEIKMWYPKPVCIKKPEKFAMMSYRRWAMEELRAFILDHPDWPPIISVEEFRAMVDDAAAEARDSDQNFMFSTAYDVATDVYDMIRRLD